MPSSSKNTNPVCVMGIGTSVPPPIPTPQYTRLLDRLFAIAEESVDPASEDGPARKAQIKELQDWTHRLVKVAGIDQRHLCIVSRDVGLSAEDLKQVKPNEHPMTEMKYFKHNAEWYYAGRRVFWKKYTQQLVTESATEALKNWGGDKERVAVVAVHSVSGWAIPSLAQHVIFDLDLPSDCRAVPVTLAGCHAGFLTTAVGRSLMMSGTTNLTGPGKHNPVCLAMTGDEMATLGKMYGGNRILDRDLHLANILFGEGSAAVVLGRPTDGDLKRSQSKGGFPIWEYHVPMCHYVPNSADALAMYLSQNEREYFNTTIKKHLPMHINSALMSKFPKVFSKLFAFKPNLKLIECDYVVHPGGKKLLDLFATVTKAFGHPDHRSTIARSMEKLRTHGNMSSNSVLFILKDTILDTKKNHIMGVSMGPGVTIEFCGFSRWGHGPFFHAKSANQTPSSFLGLSTNDLILLFVSLSLITFIAMGYSL